MYGQIYSAVAGKEGFEGSGSVLLAALAIVAVIVVQLFVIRWLWNSVLVRVVSVIRPLPSLLYTLGLLILIAMVNPGSVVAA